MPLTAAVWCQKVPFVELKLWGCRSLVPKSAISRTKVVGLLWFGTQKRHLWDQSWWGAAVWCQKGVFVGPKLVGCRSLVPKSAICGTKVGGLPQFGAKKCHFTHQSCGGAAVWCQKVAFAGPKLWGCRGLVPKSAISRTKVVWLLWFGAKKCHFTHQSCGVAVVWYQKGVFVGPKLWSCCGLVPKSAISRTKVVGLLWFGAKKCHFTHQSCGVPQFGAQKCHFTHQSCGVAAVWCQKGAFHAPKLSGSSLKWGCMKTIFCVSLLS